MVLIPIVLLIGVTSWLAWFFVHSDRGEREPTGVLWAVFGFGFLGVIAASILESFIPAKYISATHPAPIGLGLFAAAMAIGAIEELCKFLPTARYVYRKRYFNEHTDGIIYFAIAGLGFGLPENILYALSFGGATGYVRLVMTPFFHAAMTGLVGYYLVRTKLDRRPRWHVAVALLGAVILHGMYDFGLFSRKTGLVLLSLSITAGMTALLFVLYSRATAKDREAGLSVVGSNSFCRTCGYPNPSHQLYCQQCGNHA